jgi:TonB family protein
VTGSACAICGAPQPAESSTPQLCPACLLAAALSDTGAEEVSEDDRLYELPSGTPFGPFVIRRPLGHGGMAAVYEALDTQLQRPVALKVLPATFLHDQTFGRRFETEARLIAVLEHPHIVPIYAAGIEDGIPWMSMRLLGGGSLSSLLQERRLTPVEIVRLLQQVAAALDYAHAHGVVHRDIKPANILLDAAGAACVADFGLAQLMDSGSRLTRTGVLTGTPHYMSPEQALGKRVDHRCDIYSLGIVAYELLAGTTPFNSDSPMAVLLQHVNQPLPVPAVGQSGSRWMAPVQKATAKNPQERWASAGLFVVALEAAIDDGSAVVHSTTEDSGGRSWRGRASVWAAGAVSAGVIAGVVWFVPRQPPPETPPTPSPPVIVLPPVAAPMAAAQDTNEVRQGGSPSRTPTPLTSRVPASSASGSTAVPPPPSEPSKEPAVAGSSQAPAPPSAAPVAGGAPSLELVKGTPQIPPPTTPAADVFTPANAVFEVTPVYPRAAEALEVEGEVVLSGVIGVDGRVHDIKVVRSVHKALINAARDAWSKYRYKPAQRNGVLVEEARTQLFHFKMR